MKLAPLHSVLALALLSAALVAAGCSAPALPPAANYATVSGTVTDRATGKVIANALVTIDTVLKTRTDANGMFSIANVPNGTYDYTVEADGYASVSNSGTASPGEKATLNVALDARRADAGGDAASIDALSGISASVDAASAALPLEPALDR